MRFLQLYDRDTAALERRIPVGKRAVFQGLERKDGNLKYRPFGKQKLVDVDESRQLLEDFLNLAEASDYEVETYAQKNGVLGLCAHALPAGHESLRGRLSFMLAVAKQSPDAYGSVFDLLAVQWLKSNPAEIDAPCFSELDSDNFSQIVPSEIVLSEPIKLWRLYAHIAGELLRHAPKLKQNQQDRREVVEALDHWLALSPLRPSCVLDKRKRLTLQLRPVNSLSALFGVLGAQVFFAASGSKSLLVCSNCGKPYFPKQPPRTGEHTYCPRDDCKNAAWRAASYRHYWKRKGIGDDRAGKAEAREAKER
jgi:hypothetical protein